MSYPTTALFINKKMFTLNVSFRHRLIVLICLFHYHDEDKSHIVDIIVARNILRYKTCIRQLSPVSTCVFTKLILFVFLAILKPDKRDL